MKLKSCAWERCGAVLVVASSRNDSIELEDPHGQVAELLDVLEGGVASIRDLVARLGERGHTVTADEIAVAVESLDALGLVEVAGQGLDSYAQSDRHFSNLAYLDLFADLKTTIAEHRRRLRDAHVVQLGTGGLGSNVLQSLSGLGVGRVTLLDDDLVEPSNFARQFVYRNDQIGTPKVEQAAEWVRAFDPDIEVSTVRRWVSSPADLRDVLDGADLVVSGIDQPDGVDLWVNEACLRAGLPWIRGGMSGRHLLYFSVDPSSPPCYRCYVDGQTDDPQRRTADRLSRVNRGCGPAAAMVGSLVAFEALRLLTGYAPPTASGKTVMIDTADSAIAEVVPWPAREGCPDCALATARLAVPR